jgi:hypothetical protein
LSTHGSGKERDSVDEDRSEFQLISIDGIARDIIDRRSSPCRSFFFDSVAVTVKRHLVVLSGGIAALMIAVYLNDFIVEIASEKRRYEREILYQNWTVLRDTEVC